MTTAYFGDRWDAPQVDDATPVETPVGQNCLFCAEPVVAGDRGLIRAYVDVVDGEVVDGVAPVHMECDLRQALGNVYHYSGQCRHVGECQHHITGSWRQEGHALLAFVNEQRAGHGMGSL